MTDATDKDLLPETVPTGPRRPKPLSGKPMLVMLLVATVLAGTGLMGLLNAMASTPESAAEEEDKRITSSSEAAERMTKGYVAGEIPPAADGSPRHEPATDAQNLAAMGPLAMNDPGQAEETDADYPGPPPTFTKIPIASADADVAARPFQVGAVEPPHPGQSDQLLPPQSQQAQRTGGYGNGTAAAAAQVDPEAERRKQMDDQFARMRMEMFVEALQADTAVDLDRGRSRRAGSSTASAGSKLAAIDQQLAAIDTELARSPGEESFMGRLQALQAQGLVPDDGLAQGPTQGSKRGSGPNDLATYDGSSERWKLDSEVEAPTEFMLRAGWAIPATLDVHINSDLAGPIRATVRVDVKDTATGRHTLIPQGSRLLGTYAADIAHGQERLFVVWQRIVFPDGKAMDIGAMPTSDGAGRAGLSDMVNNHYAKLFFSALLMSAVSTGTTVSQDAFSQQDRVTVGGTMAQQLGQQMGQLSEEMIRQNLQIPPTIEIRQGKVLAVEVQKDLVFPSPYGAFDYLTANGQRFALKHN